MHIRMFLGTASTLLVVLGGGCSEQQEQVAGSSATNQPMAIEPNVSVGKVRAGMTVQQVLAELGEPQRKTASALEYTRLGFAILPNSNGVVQVVMCGDVTGLNGPLVKAFTGHTKEGIGMKSTREAVIKAYGEPTGSQTFPGALESLQYGPLGITFTLEGGKVHHIIVRLRDRQPVDRSVTLEPAEKGEGRR